MIVSLNQELKLDCLAQGEPRPAMRWEKLGGADFSTANKHRPLSAPEVGGKNQLASSTTATSNTNCKCPEVTAAGANYKGAHSKGRARSSLPRAPDGPN